MRCGGLAWAALVMLNLVTDSPVQAGDPRLQSLSYAADEIYPLHGHIGYQIDLEFDRDEHFVGLGSGDVEGIAFEAQDNHLFIKPKAVNVHTNLTVLTTTRVYHFDYVVAPARSDSRAQDILYALRFEYPPPAAAPSSSASSPTDAAFAADASRRNDDYWFCGEESLRPTAAWDDGVHTYLHFSSRAELPAVFVRNDDGSESLLNFSVEHDELVIHRTARQFIVRRGKLTGCIVNRSFQGSGQSLDSGTVSPDVNRATRKPAGAP